MIVFNLRCGAEHVFEGWFRSQDDYLNQRERNLVACPTCGDTCVERLLSAPRLNLSAPAVADNLPAPSSEPSAGQLLRRLRGWLARAEDVGDRFAEEARRIHYEEVPQRSIRGQASGREFAELLDEGIAVLPVPKTVVPEGELN